MQYLPWMLSGALVSPPVQAPTPTGLLQAKRIYLVNAAGDPKALDELARWLRVWNRFELVGARADADLVFTLTNSSDRSVGITAPVGSGAIVSARAVRGWFLVVESTRPPELLYSDTARSKYGDLKPIVQRLCERLETRPPSPKAPNIFRSAPKPAPHVCDLKPSKRENDER